MPGTIVFRPIEANLNLKDKDLLGKMDPYCLFHIGNEKIKSQVCKNGGNHPQWQDSISIQVPGQFGTCLVEVKDKDMLVDDKLGTCEIDMREISSLGQIRKWYPIYSKNQPAGEILIEAFVEGSNLGQGSQFGQGTYLGQGSQFNQGSYSNQQGGYLGQGGSQFSQESQQGGYLGQGSHLNQGTSYNQSSQYGQYGQTSSVPITSTKSYVQPLPQGMGTFQPSPLQSTYPSGIPSHHQPHVTPPISLSEQYAIDAISQGVDPINTQEHFQYNAQQGVMNPGFSGIPMGMNPEGKTFVGSQSSNLGASNPHLDDRNLPGFTKKHHL